MKSTLFCLGWALFGVSQAGGGCQDLQQGSKGAEADVVEERVVGVGLRLKDQAPGSYQQYEG